MIPLLGQTESSVGRGDRLRVLHNAFKQDGFGREAESGSELASAMLLVVVALAAFVLLLALLSRIQQRGQTAGDHRTGRAMFRRALRRLGIPLADRVILRFAARHARLEHPVVMLLCPALLDQHARRWAASIGNGPLRDRVQRRLDRIADYVFESVPVDPAEQAAA